MAADFAHLHLHTEYSMLDGAIRIRELCEELRRMGQESAAITDHGNMFGAFRFYEEAHHHGIRPILGVEAYLAPGDRRDREARGGENADEVYSHLTLLARTTEGYHNLVRLVSESYLSGLYYKPRMDKALLREHAGGIIALSGCLNGEAAQALKAGNAGLARAALTELAEIFGRDNVYVELMDHGLPDQAAIMKGLLELASETGLAPVATNDCHYLTRRDSFAQDVRLCISMGRTLDDPGRMRFETEEFYLKTADEMRARFAPWSLEAVSNAAAVAERCSVDLHTDGLLLPRFEAPGGISSETHFRRVAAEGLERRLAALGPHFASGAIKRPPEQYRQRLEYEMEVICKMGFPSYFLIVADFIGRARERGISVGPGRGSAAGSIVAWALEITEIDPLRYDLLFERFLNPERISMPDIDVDFCQARRGEVIDYVTDKYGRENVSQIVTFNQLKPKQAVRDVTRALGLPVALGDRISRAIPGGPDVTFDRALKESPDLRALVESDETARKVVEIAGRLEGLARHAGMHAAGVVIAPRPLTEFLPLYRTPDGQVTTQFDMAAVEKMGLLKIDFLGLITLDVLDEAVASVEKATGERIRIEGLPLNDEKTFELFRAGNTGCVFQFDSSGMRDLLRRAHPAVFADLAALNALYRPGALDAGTVEDYVRRRNGQSKVTYPLPELADILEETLGILVYQEQVMRIAQRVAGYTLAEADLLRKAIGKKKKEVMQAEAEKFLHRAVEHKCPRRKAEEIWSLIEPFARYGFNKSHAVAYALLAYRTAYLKAHHPLHFLAACLSAEIGSTDGIVKVMSECTASGVRVLPPDINESDRRFTPAGEAIRFGLAAVRGVGEAAADAILDERRAGPFRSFPDFLTRVDSRLVNRRAVEALVHAGAFDAFGNTRASLVEAYEPAAAEAARRRADQEAGQSDLFGPGDLAGGSAPTVPAREEFPMEELLRREKEALGFYVTDHPLSRFAEEIGRFADVRIAALPERVDQQVRVAGVVTSVKKQKIKKGVNAGKWMAKFVLEDMTGAVPVAVFSSLFEKSSSELEVDRPVLVTGTPRDSGGGIELTAQELSPLAGLRQRRARGVEIRVDLTEASRDTLTQVEQKLRAFPGPVPVSLRLIRPGEFEATVRANDTLSVAPSPAMEGEICALVGRDSVRYLYE